MQAKIERMTAKDFDECLELLSSAFNKEDKNAFQIMFPRLMQPTDEAMHAHHCIKAGGKMAGVAASYPLTLKYGSDSLYICGSGNIAVDESCRGKGYMSELLNHTAKEDAKDGFAFSYFHGNEARYRRFGYHKCGTQISFDISARFFEKALDTSAITFKNLMEQDDATLQKAYALYKTQYHFDRSFEDYKLALPSSYNVNTAVFKNGAFIGYIVFGNHIKNLYLESFDDFAVVMKAYLEYKSVSTITYLVPDSEYALCREAVKYSESYKLWPPANFRIYDFKKTVEFFLKVKLHNQPMDGKFTIDSDILGKWCIAVTDGTPVVTEFNGDADYSFKGLEVYDFLFGGNDFFRQNLTLAAQSILPIPIYCPYVN